MKQSRPLTSLVALLFLAPLAAAIAYDVPQAFFLDLSASQTVATPVPDVIPPFQYQTIGADGELVAGPVGVSGAITFRNDGKYAEQQAGYWAGFNATLDEGGVAVSADPFSIRAGRFTHADAVGSPYSLFVSSAPLPVLLLDMAVETDRFFYTSRWLGLNRNGRVPDPDNLINRGATIKTWGVQLGELRLGFQDALVYPDRLFDVEYLLSPVPGFFLQYVKVAAGNPWSEVGNDNSIMGLFVDYTVPRFTTYGQLLVDDFNANAILKPDSFQNPNKIAWSLGGSVRTGAGTFGLYHAGATKYTFQAYGGGSVGSATDTRYGYTYYPAVEYRVDGQTRVILPEDNYIGYLHGENNIAIMATWSHWLCPVRVSADLEYTLSGSKSPANPWHQYTAWDSPEAVADGESGTRLLNDPRLESRLVASARASIVRGRWTLFANARLGFVVNELELTAVAPELAGANNVIRYFAPGETRRMIAGIELGATLRLGL